MQKRKRIRIIRNILNSNNKMVINTIRITNSDEPVFVNANFTKKEFWNPVKIDFDLYTCIPESLQIIQDYFSAYFKKDFKLKIGWTWRPWDSLTLPPAHRICPPAVDTTPLDETLWAIVHTVLQREFQNWKESHLVKQIVNTGVNVILIENSTLHLHRRNVLLHNTKELGKVYIGEWSITNGIQNNIAYSYSN
jgi:hypothetical protein